MFRKTLVLITVLICCSTTFFFCSRKGRGYVNFVFYKDLEVDSSGLPEKNKSILQYAEKHGPSISPTYKEAVCTEYVIDVLSHFCKLTKDQKNKINIITEQNIEQLLKEDSPIPKGVYYALTSGNLGVPVEKENVKAGDFVQFWNTWGGKTTGHCGIVRAVDLKKGLISIYSSSPKTNGHGKQVYVIPDHTFFVRLR